MPRALGSNRALRITSWYPSLRSHARCSTPCRFDIGSVDQDLRECCDASLFTSVGRGKRPNRRHEGGRPLDLRHRQGASTSEIHRIAGTATQRPAERALFAASRRRSLSTAQPYSRKIRNRGLSSAIVLRKDGRPPEQIAGWLK